MPRVATGMKDPPVPTHRVLFGLAMAQGALSVLAWGFLGQPAMGGIAWHVHELVFGQAIAVIGGYLLVRLPAWRLLALTAVWIGARLAPLIPFAPEELWAALSIGATAAIAIPAAQAFLRGAKRLGNFVFPVLLSGFVIADIAFYVGMLSAAAWLADLGLRLGLGLLVLLIAAMGGRLLSAAASGAAQWAGGARIPPQHGLERAVLALIAVGFLANAADAEVVAAPVLLVVAGGLLTARIARWSPGLRQSGGDVRALAVGQAWLGLGLLTWCLVRMGLELPVASQSALHLATIGGIGGTLLVMMMRTVAQRERAPAPCRPAEVVAGLMAAAALARAFGPPDWGWPMAAALWMAATLVAAITTFTPRAP